jgi:hypothetical protein
VSFGLLLGNALENEGGEGRVLGQAHAGGTSPRTCYDGI